MADKTMVKKITKPLPCKLEEAEVTQYGRDMARAMNDKARIQAEADSIKQEYKSKIEEQSAIVEKLSGRVHSGIETRDVECQQIMNWTKGTVSVTRMDTREIIEKRPMREDEKQSEMKLGDGEGEA